MRTTAAISIAAMLAALPAAAQVAVVPPETDIVFEAPNAAEMEGYTLYDLTTGELNYERDLDDAEVYSSITNEEIGDVDEVYPGVDTANTYLELDIGGFLGIGEKEILVPLDQVSIYRGPDDFRVYIAATEEELEAYPDYDD